MQLIGRKRETEELTRLKDSASPIHTPSKRHLASPGLRPRHTPCKRLMPRWIW